MGGRPPFLNSIFYSSIFQILARFRNVSIRVGVYFFTSHHEKFEDTNEVITNRKSKETKDRVTRTPLKTDKTMAKKPKKWINNDLQNFTQKTKD